MRDLHRVNLSLVVFVMQKSDTALVCHSPVWSYPDSCIRWMIRRFGWRVALFNGRLHCSEVERQRFACRMVKMQEEREAPRRFSDTVDLPPSITALNLPARDRAGVGPPIEYEGADRPPIRVVLADSENLFRVGIQTIFALEDDIRVIAQADTLAGLHHTIQRFPTDVILLVEGKLIASTGDAIAELVRRWPKLKIIVSAEKNDETNTVELYFQGVQGIIPRSISPDLLVKCVRRIAAGETWIDNQSINCVIEAYRSQATALTSQPYLSPKELAIVTCITQGMRNKAIAFQLGTSEQVIKNYLRKVYGKIGVADRLELALYCLRHPQHKNAHDRRVPLAQPLAIRLILPRSERQEHAP
jgi:two-component system, NarL family, nitrate/nitrite response regulator NarL